MVSKKLIQVAKNEILRSKNLDSNYLNSFLNDYKVKPTTGAFIGVNLDACQFKAKLQLEMENLLVWNNETNKHDFK